MTTTDTPAAESPPETRKLGAVKTWVARIAGAAAAAALLAASGLYALDRVDAAADRQAAEQVAMQVTVQDTLAKQMARHAADLEQAVDDLAEVLVEIDGNRIANNNRAIDQSNESIETATELARMSDCFGFRVNGVHQQNGCFLQHIGQMLPYLITAPTG